MIFNLDAKKLKVGMFVNLSVSWAENPFWNKSQFEITSEKEIKKIQKAGIKIVKVDTDKSKVQIESPQKDKIKKTKKNISSPNVSKKVDTKNTNKVSKKTNVCTEKKQDKVVEEKARVIDKPPPEKLDSDDSTPPLEWDPKKFMPKEIADAFADKSLPPDDRAKVVQAYSMEMMKNILENPTAEVISASKIGISEIVDVILNEDETTQGLAKLVSHDFYTYTHSVNVGMKAIIFAKKLYKNVEKHNMDELGAGFFLHDIGKVAIDSSIINKPGKFSEDEMNLMRTHPYKGYQILSETKQLTEEAWVIVMQHHERDDGKWYPRKLKGDEIHPYARICSIADVYDALTAKRSYKKDKKPIEALKIMYKEMANHFNKKLLEKFIQIFKEK